MVLKNNKIKEQFYLGRIFIYKNTLLKNTVEWHTPKKIKDLWGIGRVRGKKEKIFCKEFERESLSLAYTKRRKKKPIYFHLSLFHRYKKRSPVPFRGYDDIKCVKSQKRDVFSKLNLVKMYGKLTGCFLV